MALHLSSQIVSKVQLRGAGCDPRRQNFQLLLHKFETSNAPPHTFFCSSKMKIIWQILKQPPSPFSPSVLLNISFESIWESVTSYIIQQSQIWRAKDQAPSPQPHFQYFCLMIALWYVPTTYPPTYALTGVVARVATTSKKSADRMISDHSLATTPVSA